MCDSEFSDATIELSDAAIDDMAEINLRVNKEGVKELAVNRTEQDQNHQSLVKRVQLNHR